MLQWRSDIQRLIGHFRLCNIYFRLQSDYSDCRMTAMQTDPILIKIERFLKRHPMGETTFGLKMAGDRNLVKQLREGRELRRATRDAVLQAMQEAVSK